MFEAFGATLILLTLAAMVFGPWFRLSQINGRVAESRDWLFRLRRDHETLANEVHALRERLEGTSAALESLKASATHAPVDHAAEQAAEPEAAPTIAMEEQAPRRAEHPETPPPLPVIAPAGEAPAMVYRETVSEEAARPIAGAAEAAPPPLPEMPPVTTPRSEPAPLLRAFVEEAHTSGNWEALIGGNILNKLGALVLVIGIALLLSYSFAHMGAAGRAMTGLGVGVAMLGGGLWRERSEKYRIFARGLIAAGWASLYFTSYAMYAIPATKIIESPAVGLALTIAVAAAMVWHSLRYKAQALTALAYGCVFAALALTDLTLFAVAALVPLAASMLYLARRFEWREMALFGAAATYATFLSRPDMGTPLMTVQAMLVVFWVMFEGFDLLRVALRRPARAVDHAFFAVNAIAGLGASAALWYRKEPDSMWQFCAGAAMLYLASTILRILLDEPSLYEAALAISAALAGLAIFAHVHGIWISVGLMMEAEILFLAGVYLGLRLARVLALAGFAWSVVQAGFETGSTSVFGARIDNWAPPLTVLALMFYANRWIAKGASYFSYFASAFLAIVIGYELPWRYAGGAWVVLGAALFEFGDRRKLAEFRYQGYALGLLGAADISLRALDVSTFLPWLHVAVIAVAVACAVRARHSFDDLPEFERLGMLWGGWTGAAVLVALGLYREVSGGMLTLSWGLEGIALLAIGFAARERMLRLSGLALLLGCILKLFLYDLRNLETGFRILSFIGLGVILLAVSWIYTRFKDEIQKYL